MKRENSEPLSDYAATQIEVGTIATAYEPYSGVTIPITFPSSAGTVYGGSLDVTTGLLTVDRALVDLGTLNYDEYGGSNTVTQYYTTALDVLAKNYSRIVSDVFVYSANLAPWTCRMATPPGKTYLRTPKDQYSSPANFKTAMSGVQLVYELATPQTYQLTPVEIEMLLGDNNVWADTGDSTVTYRADTKLYIQKINTPTDDDMIADAQIASGKYFIIGGNLYKSTTTIPAGDAINPGSNCILTNLADALNALNT
jgi:hypothetical protein